MQSKAVLTKLITKAIQGTYEPQITKRYLREFNFGASPKSDDIYALALKFLNQGETEICISYIIASLDVEKDHNPTFHLAKTMVFSLSEEFEKSGGQLYKQKHSDLIKYVQLLEKNISKLESDLMTTKNSLKQLESETGMFAKMKNKSKIAELQTEIPEVNDKLDKNKKELKKVSYLTQIEEYMKILSLIMEVITFPSRYSWVYKS
jgi:predicted RNase H-like nuclease (RuvC/YqgF family)